MGPNGSGKSTLAQVLAGHPALHGARWDGDVRGKDLLGMKPESVRVQVSSRVSVSGRIRGITNSYFLRSAAERASQGAGEPELDPIDFLQFLEQKLKAIGWDDSMMNRP